MAKPRVGIIFGGRSAEHEISLESARNVVAAIDRTRYDVTLIAITKQGRWLSHESARALLEDGAAPPAEGDAYALVPGVAESRFVTFREGAPIPLDIVFPVLHGTYGEDGTVQGLLKLMDIPFVGPGVLGSAVAMDKDVMKRLFREAGIPTPRFLAFHRGRGTEPAFDSVRDQLGMPCFIKPANLGSSVGISKARDAKGFDAAVAEAFRFDTKIIVEEAIEGREIECAVLGNENPEASVPGEVAPTHEFYSYEAKYLDDHGANLIVPAELPQEVAAEVRRLAVRSFHALCCEGMGRVDFFLQEDGRILVNEINTIPGFTRISMYPKLWEATGVPYSELVNRLLQLALDRHARDGRLCADYGTR